MTSNGTIIAPRVAAEELVAPGARQHDLDELAGELGDVEVGIALADARLLQMPGQPSA